MDPESTALPPNLRRIFVATLLPLSLWGLELVNHVIDVDADSTREANEHENDEEEDCNASEDKIEQKI